MRYYLLSCIFLFVLPDIRGQRTISGTVTDEYGLILPGAYIVEQKTINNVISDAEGRFSITVSDSATIRISFIGFRDTIISASGYIEETIILQFLPPPDDLVIWQPPRYSRTWSLGYYGDLNRLPAGITASYRIRKFYRSYGSIAGHLIFKTNFRSEYDLTLSLVKGRILDLGAYRLHGTVSWQTRKLVDLDRNDFRIILGNDLYDRVTLNIGINFRSDPSDDTRPDRGLILGIDHNIYKTATDLSGSVICYGDRIEYGLYVLQQLSKHRKFWRNIRCGLAFNHYHDYRELNLVLKYAPSY